MKRYQMWRVWVYERTGQESKWPSGGTAFFKWAQEHWGGDQPPAVTLSQMMDIWKDVLERARANGGKGEPELTNSADTIIGKSEDGLLGFIAYRGRSNIGHPVW